MKSYLIVGTGDLLHLDTAIRQMLVKKKHDYLQEAARQEVKLRRHYVGKDWLGELPTQMSYTAVNLIAWQHRAALAALLGRQELPSFPDNCHFTQ